jgi:DNA-binding NarL/FixJ family response regulator
VRVVIAEDLVLLREGIESLLTSAGFDVVGAVGDADALLALVDRVEPDVVIVDIRMPPTHTDEGIQATKQIRAAHPSVAVLVLSQHLDTGFALELVTEGGGGIGYLLKDRVADRHEFADAVRRVAHGEAVVDLEVVTRLMRRRRTHNPLDDLTDRERDVLRLMTEGRSNQAIAQLLLMSPRTVEAHVRAIFSKLGLEPAADDHRRVLAVLTYLRG